MRLFVASKAHIFDYDALKKRWESYLQGRWVPPQNLHLTWKFIGNSLEKAEAVEKLKRLELCLTNKVPIVGLGSFGVPPKILYGALDERALMAQKHAFEKIGFGNDRFVPHVTLCRIKSDTPKEWSDFQTYLQEFDNKILGYIEPTITLFESKLTSKGAHYRELFTLSQAPSISPH